MLLIVLLLTNLWLWECAVIQCQCLLEQCSKLHVYSHMLVVLGEDDRERRGEETVRRGMQELWEEFQWWGWGGQWVTKKLTITFQLLPKWHNVFCILVCLTNCSRLTLHLSAFYLCSHWIQRQLVCTGKRSWDNEVDYMGKHIPIDIVARFYACTGMWERTLLPERGK